MSGIVERLAPGGNLVLNVGQDVFEKGVPSRSLYIERITLALHDRLGLSLMDRLVWDNPCKPPGPIQWASIHRKQLNVGYEFALWFTNDPSRVISNNQAVLQPHTEQHQKLMARGGVTRSSRHSDGACSLREGKSYSRQTPGRIPTNVLRFPSGDGAQRRYKKAAKSLGMPAHWRELSSGSCAIFGAIPGRGKRVGRR